MSWLSFKFKVYSLKADLKLPGKYNKQAGNQTAGDFFWFYFSFFSVAGGHVLSSWQPPRRRPLGFVCHAFTYGPWGRNECVTNELQRTSAGRLSSWGKSPTPPLSDKPVSLIKIATPFSIIPFRLQSSHVLTSTCQNRINCCYMQETFLGFIGLFLQTKF